MAARSGDRLVVGDISMSVRALGLSRALLRGLLWENDDLAKANRCYRPYQVLFRSVLIGRLERAFVTVDITIMNVNIFQNDVIFREAQFL